jgi:hypothetical protein
MSYICFLKTIMDIHKKIKDFEGSLKIFAHKLAEQGKETEAAAKIIEKHIKGIDVTPEEDVLLKQNIYDTLKIAGIGIPFILIPGASVILPALIILAKKHDIELLPSKFIGNEKEN